MSNQETLNELSKRIASLKAEYKSLASDEFNKITAELFEKAPTVQDVSWVNYGANFDDGDYSGPYAATWFDVTTTDGEEHEEMSKNDNSAGPEVKEFVTGFYELIEAIGSDTLLELHGHDVRVTINRDSKIFKEEYYRY